MKNSKKVRKRNHNRRTRRNRRLQLPPAASRQVRSTAKAWGKLALLRRSALRLRPLGRLMSTPPKKVESVKVRGPRTRKPPVLPQRRAPPPRKVGSAKANAPKRR